MSRITPERRMTLIQADAVRQAFLEASTIYWRRRAEQLEAAAPRPGDFTGHATERELDNQTRRCLDSAIACRNRAAGADGWVDQVLGGAAADLQGAA